MKKTNRTGSRLFIGLVFLFLYAPIILLIIFSFNAGDSSAVWKGFSLHWYGRLFQNRLIMESVYTTLLVSLLATAIATAAGTFAAIGLYSLGRLWQDGVQMMTLTWNGVNEIGSGSDDPGMPLTPFGREVVARMEQLGMVVDVSHLNDPGFWDVARVARRPFIATHSDSRAVCGHSRNLTDDQFKAIRDAGGIVGINFCTMFLAPVEEGCREVSPGQLMAHVLHFLDLHGEDTVALGSDFDGTTLPAFMEDATSLPVLRELMLSAGLGERLTDKICFQNALDFWKRYQKTAL